MTKLNAIRPMLYTAQLNETVHFYVHQLGFTSSNFNQDWGWATLQRDDIEIMICLPNQQSPFQGPKFTGSFYINTTNVEAIWEELKDKAIICYPLETFDYRMKEFAIYDNNGYLLQFGEAV